MQEMDISMPRHPIYHAAMVVINAWDGNAVGLSILTSAAAHAMNVMARREYVGAADVAAAVAMVGRASEAAIDGDDERRAALYDAMTAFAAGLGDGESFEPTKSDERELVDALVVLVRRGRAKARAIGESYDVVERVLTAFGAEDWRGDVEKALSGRIDGSVH